MRAAEPVGSRTAADEGPLAQQLRALFPELVRDASIKQPAGRFAGDPFVRDLVELILFCACADPPVAADTLFALPGSDPLNSLDRLREAFGTTALIQEAETDSEGTIALATARRLHARRLLRAIRRNAAARLDVPRNLVERGPRNLDACPGDNPARDDVIRVLRQAGPRGGAASDHGSAAAPGALADILKTIRMRHGKRRPVLPSLEAIIRGAIARQDVKAAFDEQRRQCKAAPELLDAAIEVLRGRRPSDARSLQLRRALALAANIRGTEPNGVLRGGAPSPSEVQGILKELRADVTMARSCDTRHPPLDILCRANRDARNLLAPVGVDAPDFEIELPATMQTALEVADEEQVIDEERRSRPDGRGIALDRIPGKAPLARARAAEMRARGNFAGAMILSRIAVDEAERHQVTCRDELARFPGFGPAAVSDVRALRYPCAGCG